MIVRRLVLAVSLLAVSLLVGGCDSEQGQNEQRNIHTEDMPAVLRLVRQDLDRGLSGTQQAADLMARAFLVEDPVRQEREIRMVLRRIQVPPRAIDELMTSPISFVAAVGMDGKVIARDADPDLMRGYDIGASAPVVQRALQRGEAAHELSLLPSLQEGEPPSVTIIFAAPALRHGEVVGAIVAGLPLWRMGQQMTRQLQLDNASQIRRGELVWVFFYYEDEQHYHAGFPPALLELAPDAAARRTGLSQRPGGYTGEVQQYGRWYGYGVLPMPTLGENVGAIFFRSDPT